MPQDGAQIRCRKLFHLFLVSAGFFDDVSEPRKLVVGCAVDAVADRYAPNLRPDVRCFEHGRGISRSPLVACGFDIAIPDEVEELLIFVFVIVGG